MLRKHFRGYRSSWRLLQYTSTRGNKPIKVRGKPLEEVIRFTLLEHDGKDNAQHLMPWANCLPGLDDGGASMVVTPLHKQQAISN